MTEFEKSLAATPVVPGRIVCPNCRGVGRRYDVDEVGEPCMACREDGYLDPGDVHPVAPQPHTERIPPTGTVRTRKASHDGEPRLDPF